MNGIKDLIQKLIPERLDFAIAAVFAGISWQFSVALGLVVCGIIVIVLELIQVYVSNRGN